MTPLELPDHQSMLNHLLRRPALVMLDDDWPDKRCDKSNKSSAAIDHNAPMHAILYDTRERLGRGMALDVNLERYRHHQYHQTASGR